MGKRFCICECYYTCNFFIKEYEMHVKFVDGEQFLNDYRKILLSKSCYNPESLIPQLKKEYNRRRQVEALNIRQRQCVLQWYTPRHPHLYTLQQSFLDSRFLEVVEAAQQPDQTCEALARLLQDHQQRVFSFPVFTKEFCEMFVEELTNYEEAPIQKSRPNTMNLYGIKLDELGFTDFVSSLQKEYLTPITRLLFPEWGGGSLDSHKAFVVTYKDGEDVDLSYHYDNAEVTLNVALNEDYSNGELYFGPMRSEVSSRRFGYTHQLGRGLLHRGQQFHGALPITSGIRHNLIIWMRSSEVRNKLCPMCNMTPKLVPVKEGFGDGFTQNEEDVCTLN
ncbi:2-oxoglutarate and iron-dependent oxygenase domain-containing protein 2 [Portunus trituberculatus]|uniref:2-oxoglutarate and iron-dependent oxygenase domain-containing protein 2 n=1 Tax=Portunus trituberculatus TaxID=210409 RepID=A0A5B7DI88_PORTR|nr:2-oxoglutarate and iron-dependent oxygenase domain-containing protein 2 [Portunus trituberculatus]